MLKIILLEGTMYGQLRKDDGMKKVQKFPLFLTIFPRDHNLKQREKAVLGNSVVNKALPLLSGWRAWNRVKNHSNVILQKISFKMNIFFFWLRVIREFFSLNKKITTQSPASF